MSKTTLLADAERALHLDGFFVSHCETGAIWLHNQARVGGATKIARAVLRKLQPRVTWNVKTVGDLIEISIAS